MTVAPAGPPAIALHRRAARGASTGRPVMALFDLLGRRSTLRILWELRDGHPQGFRLLRSSCDAISPSVLNPRLKELREALLLELGDSGYARARQGADRVGHLKPLNRFAERWATPPA